nr:small GTPase superfamily [Tanacetum cinerariifolium]
MVEVLMVKLHRNQHVAVLKQTKKCFRGAALHKKKVMAWDGHHGARADGANPGTVRRHKMLGWYDGTTPPAMRAARS